MARPPWRWRASTDPRQVYRPASSAVGMYQITDATFSEAKRYCIRDDAVLEEGCWTEQKHNLAALIHLCGASAGEAYVRRGFRLSEKQRCGEHDVRAYLGRVNAMKRAFARMSTFR